MSFKINVRYRITLDIYIYTSDLALACSLYFYLHCRCSEKFYDPAKFQGRVALFPFDDDNAPPFELITPFCEDMDEWLNKDDKNIAIVHCLDGRVIRYSYTYIY